MLQKLDKTLCRRELFFQFQYMLKHLLKNCKHFLQQLGTLWWNLQHPFGPKRRSRTRKPVEHNIFARPKVAPMWILVKPPIFWSVVEQPKGMTCYFLEIMGFYSFQRLGFQNHCTFSGVFQSYGRSGVDVFFLNRGLIDGSSVIISTQGERRRLPKMMICFQVHFFCLCDW